MAHLMQCRKPETLVFQVKTFAQTVAYSDSTSMVGNCSSRWWTEKVDNYHLIQENQMLNKSTYSIIKDVREIFN